MKRLTRREFTAAEILAALSAGISVSPGCGAGGPAEFDPSENEEVDVYGPPPEDVDDDGFRPDRNEMALVYGPPPDDVGPSDAYAPHLNEHVVVYGPPDFNRAD